MIPWSDSSRSKGALIPNGPIERDFLFMVNSTRTRLYCTLVGKGHVPVLGESINGRMGRWN